ncbi:BamA/TamA family outer membrane protein [Flavobacteriaceae bacterium]|nr:BamA/TamA family outer membrane protein [Flavobacteriaceae bacterium]
MNIPHKYLCIILIISISSSVFSQTSALLQEPDVDEKQTVIYLNSTENDVNLKNLTKNIKKKIDSLKSQGYFNVAIKDRIKIDSIKYKFILDLNQKFENIYIYGVNNMISFNHQKVKTIEDKDYYSIKINELESFLSKSSEDIANKGYPFNKVQLVNIKKLDSENLYASIVITLNQKRKIDKIDIKGYENFPKTFLKHYLKYSNTDDFNFDKIKDKSKEINNLGFVRQLKDPEVLFKKDSTIVYLYLEKVKNNSFDGFIGFATNEETNKLDLNGYMNVKLNNTLNYAEQINLNYRSTNNNDRFLKSSITVPFIFNTPLGLDLKLNLTKKDTTYTNDEQSIGVNFITKNKHNISFHLSSLNSTSTLDNSNDLIKDYKSSFKKVKYNYNKVNNSNNLIPIKFLTSVELSVGKREDNTETKNQIKYIARVFNNFNLTKSSSIYLNLESYALSSTNYYLNEMLLFGGINSIRGFEESSIATNKLFLVNTEYRLMLDKDIYINTIFDTAYYENPLNNIKDYIYGVGFGLNINANSGVFRINYANGFKKGEDIDLKLSKIHVSFSNIF